MRTPILPPLFLVSIIKLSLRFGHCWTLLILDYSQVLISCIASLPMTVWSLSRKPTSELLCEVPVEEHELSEGSQALDSSN